MTALALSPAYARVNAESTFQFTASGGTGPYVFSVIGSGSVDGTGLYTAGDSGADTVVVTDSLSATASSSVQINTALTQSLMQYYANLLILQYKSKPKAYATIQALAAPALMDQLPITAQNAFNLDGTAIGAQLDVLGKYIGISRNGYNFTGPVTLNDSDYLTVLKLKIILNNFTASLSVIQNFFLDNFPGVFQIFDYQDMTMDYVVDSGVVSSNLAQFFIKAGLLPRPTGVRLRALVFAPTTNEFFGYQTYDYQGWPNQGFNTYDSYSMTDPWLTYSNILVE